MLFRCMTCRTVPRNLNHSLLGGGSRLLSFTNPRLSRAGDLYRCFRIKYRIAQWFHRNLMSYPTLACRSSLESMLRPATPWTRPMMAFSSIHMDGTTIASGTARHAPGAAMELRATTSCKATVLIKTSRWLIATRLPCSPCRLHASRTLSITARSAAAQPPIHTLGRRRHQLHRRPRRRLARTPMCSRPS